MIPDPDDETLNEIELDPSLFGEERPAPGAERRSEPREPVHLKVRFRSPSDLASAFTGVSRDLSRGGLCLLTTRAYEPGARLQLDLEAGETPPLSVSAVVAWSKPGRAVGLRFENLTEHARLVLEQVLAAASAGRPASGPKG